MVAGWGASSTFWALCGASIHDLSRVFRVPAGFNMPFELGLAYAVSRLRSPHAFVLLESVRFRLQITLSDLNGHDPYLHGATVRGTIDCILNALRPTTGAPTATDVYRLYTDMRVAAKRLKASHHRTVFTRSIFLDLVAFGVQRARQAKLLAS